MDEQGKKTYSLNEIKSLVFGDAVDESNLGDILNSLIEFDFDDEIREILDKLSDNVNIPESIRKNLKATVQNYDEIVEAREERIENERRAAEEQLIIEEEQQKIAIEEQQKNEAEKLEEEKNLSDNETEGNNANNPDEVLTENDMANEDVISIVADEQETNKEDSPFQPVEVQEGFYDDAISNANASYSNDNRSSLTNDMILAGVTAYAINKGINVMSQNPGIFEYPELSLELDENSKPYIDNLLLTLYNNKEDVNASLTRISSSGKEVLTLRIDNPELSQAQLQEKGKQLFSNVEKILKETNEEKDYEAKMPPELKTLKDKFHNDDPKIPDADFKVGFSNSDGKSSYYLIANNEYQAKELAELMGYEIKEDRGGNVFEMDTTNKNMDGTKIDKVTEEINEIDEVKDPKNGISDVDINYNNRHYDNGEENYERIESFVKDNRDPSTMSIIQVNAQDNGQRIVTLASTDGTRETLVFHNGEDFDKSLPRIANVYGDGENTSIAQNNIVKVDYNNGTSSYEALSSDNTYLRLNNFDSSTIDQVNNTISNFVVNEENVKTSTNQKENNYVKTLGTYPSNTYKQAANTSFLALLAFIFILILGIMIVYVIYGG